MHTTHEVDAWAMIHAERVRVRTMLEGLSPHQWSTASLCTAWSVEQVTAHLTAAASTGRWAWVRSIVRAGFNPGRHNEARLAQHLGRDPGETLARFAHAVPLTVAPTRDYAAWLGEVIVHGQDIAQPLGIDLVPDPAAVRVVADFYVRKDFAVNSRRLVTGLSLDADDAAFHAGIGPDVRGPVLDLVMIMAGRASALTRLRGDGVEELGRRIG